MQNFIILLLFFFSNFGPVFVPLWRISILFFCLFFKLAGSLQNLSYFLGVSPAVYSFFQISVHFTGENTTFDFCDLFCFFGSDNRTTRPPFFCVHSYSSTQRQFAVRQRPADGWMLTLSGIKTIAEMSNAVFTCPSRVRTREWRQRAVAGDAFSPGFPPLAPFFINIFFVLQHKTPPLPRCRHCHALTREVNGKGYWDLGVKTALLILSPSIPFGPSL